AYPEWVSGRYLQLPDTITPETVALAEELAGDLTNPYDKSIAIRDYLRANIEYNDQIDAPPEGVDPVHHVLFNAPEAYCTYYASAMAVMLRSQGVPARLVSGYALGDYDEPSQSYRVRAVNAHTWVEVFSPSYGWIHSEPAASMPVAERPTSSGGDLASVVDEAAAGEPESLLPPEDLLDNALGEGELDNPSDLGSQADDGGQITWWQIAI